MKERDIIIIYFINAYSKWVLWKRDEIELKQEQGNELRVYHRHVHEVTAAWNIPLAVEGVRRGLKWMYSGSTELADEVHVGGKK